MSAAAPAITPAASRGADELPAPVSGQRHEIGNLDRRVEKLRQAEPRKDRGLDAPLDRLVLGQHALERAAYVPDEGLRSVVHEALHRELARHQARHQHGMLVCP